MANRELIEEILAATAGRQVRFEWVRGHVGHPLNAAADRAATAASAAVGAGRLPEDGPGWTVVPSVTTAHYTGPASSPGMLGR